MKTLILYTAWIITIALAGCSSSSPEAIHTTAIPSQPRKDLPHTEAKPPAHQNTDPAKQHPVPGEIDQAKKWKPRYIQTGLASGIMVEFTGMKKGKKLSAKYASLELSRDLADTTLPQSAKNLPGLATPVHLQGTINDLQQVFFKVSPGTYLARLTNDWCDRSYISNVMVKDGEYSVLTNDVYAAWLRMKQLSDSTEER